MEKFVVRSGFSTNSLIAGQKLMEKYGCQKIQMLNRFLDNQTLLRELYHDSKKYEELLSDYDVFVNCGESSNFEWGYLIRPEFVICISNHIEFCHLDKGVQIFPWKYIDRGVYLADTWWFSNDEIISDATALSVVDFLKKYW